MFDSWPTDSYAQTALQTWSQSQYFQQAGTIAQNEGINPTFFQTVIGAESGFDPNASNGDAQGIAQFMPGTAQQYGVNRYDPESSLAGAATYFRNLLGECNGDYVCASVKYGTIPGNSDSLTQNQQLVLQAAANADTGQGIKVTEIGPGVNKALNNVQLACGTFEITCYIKKYGADLLTILAGLAILIIGLVMLKDSAGIIPTATNLTAGTIKRMGKAVAA